MVPLLQPLASKDCIIPSHLYIDRYALRVFQPENFVEGIPLVLGTVQTFGTASTGGVARTCARGSDHFPGVEHGPILGLPCESGVLQMSELSPTPAVSQFPASDQDSALARSDSFELILELAVSQSPCSGPTLLPEICPSSKLSVRIVPRIRKVRSRMSRKAHAYSRLRPVYGSTFTLLWGRA